MLTVGDLLRPQPKGLQAVPFLLAQATERLVHGTADRRQYDWLYQTRERLNQRPPSGTWRVWLILAGRGFGKTRAGAEWVRAEIEAKRAGRIALVAPTAADVRDVMVEGPSGILATAPPWCRPVYEPSRRKLTWPNGAIAMTYSADEPERLRGPQSDLAWFDELCAARLAQATWDMLMLGLRLGQNPRCLVTTTPKPLPLLNELLRRAQETHDVVVTTGSTYENRANLAPAYFEQIVSRYEGTRLGRQELHAEVLSEAEGALWKRDWFDATRVATAPTLQRIVVAIDPAASHTDTSDETGIIAAAAGADQRGYVLADQSGRYSPDGWARVAIQLYSQLHANAIVVEKNNGGDMVSHTIRTTAQAMHAAGELVTPLLPIKVVWASHGKAARAEPVAALYEQGRVSHVGEFKALEDQCVTWAPQSGDRSPDRLDAVVWALTDLMLQRRATGPIQLVGY